MLSRLSLRWASSFTPQRVEGAKNILSNVPSTTIDPLTSLLKEHILPIIESNKPLSRNDFDNLHKQLQNNKEFSQTASFPTLNIINNSILQTLKYSSISDREYFMNELNSSTLPWIRLYPMIHLRKYSDSVAMIKNLWNISGKSDSDFNFIDIPSSTLGCLFDKMIDESLLVKYFDFFEWLENYYCPTRKALYEKNFYSHYIRRFIQKCIDLPSTSNNHILAKFFEKYILYTGPDQKIKNEVIYIESPLLESMIATFQKNGNIAEYSKAVAYYIKRLTKEKKFTDMNEWRFKSRIAKFDMYINKLGPYVVMENGMFYNFRLPFNKCVRLENHMLNFTNSLTKYLSNTDISEITLEQFLLMIEFMHGLHIQPYKEQYSKYLNPDIQMARIYRSIIKKTAEPDPIILHNYNEIIRMEKNKDFKHMKEGIPRHKTLNQRILGDKGNHEISQSKSFQSLPLEIILRVIYNISQMEKYEKDIKKLAMTGVMLFQLMVIERNVCPKQDCFAELIKIVQLHPSTREQTPFIMSIHGRYHGEVSPVMKSTLESYGLSLDGTPLAVSVSVDS